jgi:hypothetical protein
MQEATLGNQELQEDRFLQQPLEIFAFPCDSSGKGQIFSQGLCGYYTLHRREIEQLFQLCNSRSQRTFIRFSYFSLQIHQANDLLLQQ